MGSDFPIPFCANPAELSLLTPPEAPGICFGRFPPSDRQRRAPVDFFRSRFPHRCRIRPPCGDSPGLSRGRALQGRDRPRAAARSGSSGTLGRLDQSPRARAGRGAGAASRCTMDSAPYRDRTRDRLRRLGGRSHAFRPALRAEPYADVRTAFRAASGAADGTAGIGGLWQRLPFRRKNRNASPPGT